MSRGPAVAAWLIAALTAVAVAGSVYRLPIQVSDCLEVIQRVIPMPSAAAAFVEGLQNSGTMLRPLKEVRTKLLVELGDALGGRYHLVFRGYHALAGVVLIGLFVWVCRARTWADAAALAFALVVLTGMHTFVGLFREAFPVNHFLIVAICTLATFAIAHTRGGWVADAIAVGLLVVAALSFESGLLVWPVAIAAYASGLRGISRRGLIAMTMFLVIYAGGRKLLLAHETLGIGQRTTGFGTGALTPEEQVARFGGNPVPLYAYNASAAAASVMFSQPRTGQFTAVAAWRDGSLPPVYVVQIGSSLLTTLLIAWYVLGRGPDGRRRWREPVPLAFITVLAVSALMSYAYAKDEIVSAAGVFYALAAFSAIRALVARQPATWFAPVLIVAALALSSAWAIRSAGLHLKLRHGAFEARSEWTYVLSQTARSKPPTDAHTLQVVGRMRDEVLMQQTIAPAMLPRWTERWWGED